MKSAARPADPFTLAALAEAAVLEQRAAMERDRRMPAPLLESLRASGAFALFTPRELGGHELPLAGALRVLEAFGRLDPAVAWNVWNGNLGFSAAMLPESGVRAIWSESTRDPVIANSARPAGVAKTAGAGFVLSGRWDIVSAVDSADWVALFALVDPDPARPGPPDVRVFYVPHAELRVLDTWRVNAMRGTGSNTVIAESIFVRADLVVSPFAPARIDRPLYRIPAFTLASTGAAAVVLGTAQGAIDAALALAASKPTEDGRKLADRPQAQGELGRAQAALHAARLLLYAAAEAIDTAAAERRPVGEDLRAPLRAAMAHAASTARQVLAAMYTLASSSALYDGQPIERLFRDGTAAAQHAILHGAHLETYGRVLLGQPAGVPVL